MLLATELHSEAKLKVLLSELKVNTSLLQVVPGELVKVNSQKQLEAYLALI